MLSVYPLVFEFFRMVLRVANSSMLYFFVAVSTLLLSACASTSLERKQISKPVVVPVNIPAIAKYDVVDPGQVTLVAVGDMMFGGKGTWLLEKNGYTYPFAGTKHLLQAADITIGNLETALTSQGEPRVEKKYLFRNPPEKVAPALAEVGFDIVSLANNHSLDYGEQGLIDTINILQEYGIHHHGAGMNLAEARQHVVITLPNKQKAGFLAYSNTFPEEFWATRRRAGTAFGHAHHVSEDVARLKALGVDIIVVSFHWGRESTTELREYQPLLAHTAIDAGADLVIGHHPHILQGVELYKNALILYSLGNYTFATYSTRVQTSVVANIEFRHGQVSGLMMTPININNFEVELQPQVLYDESAQSVFIELKKLSHNIPLIMNEHSQIVWRK